MFRPVRFLPYFVHGFTIAQCFEFVFFNKLIVVYRKFIRYFALNWFYRKIRKKHHVSWCFSQGYKDSNLEMTESESVALPFGDSPIICCFLKKWIKISDSIIIQSFYFLVKRFFYDDKIFCKNILKSFSMVSLSFQRLPFSDSLIHFYYIILNEYHTCSVWYLVDVLAKIYIWYWGIIFRCIRL